MTQNGVAGLGSVAEAQPTTGIAGGFAVAPGSSNSKVTVVRTGAGRALWSPAATQGGATSDARVRGRVVTWLHRMGCPARTCRRQPSPPRQKPPSPQFCAVCLAVGVQYCLSPHRWCRPYTVDAAMHIQGNVDPRRTTACGYGDCRGHPHIQRRHQRGRACGDYRGQENTMP